MDESGGIGAWRRREGRCRVDGRGREREVKRSAEEIQTWDGAVGLRGTIGTLLAPDDGGPP